MKTKNLTPPDWMQNLDFPVRPQTVCSPVTGEVLIGDEVSELRKGDGLSGRKIGKPGKKKRKIRGEK